MCVWKKKSGVLVEKFEHLRLFISVRAKTLVLELGPLQHVTFGVRQQLGRYLFSCMILPLNYSKYIKDLTGPGR